MMINLSWYLKWDKVISVKEFCENFYFVDIDKKILRNSIFKKFVATTYEFLANDSINYMCRDFRDVCINAIFFAVYAKKDFNFEHNLDELCRTLYKPTLEVPEISREQRRVLIVYVEILHNYLTSDLESPDITTLISNMKISKQGLKYRMLVENDRILKEFREYLVNLGIWQYDLNPFSCEIKLMGKHSEEQFKNHLVNINKTLYDIFFEEPMICKKYLHLEKTELVMD